MTSYWIFNLDHTKPSKPCLGAAKSTEDCFRNRGPRSRTTAARATMHFCIYGLYFYPAMKYCFGRSTIDVLDHQTAGSSGDIRSLSSIFLSPRSRLLHNSLFLNEASKYNKWSPNDDAQVQPGLSAIRSRQIYFRAEQSLCWPGMLNEANCNCHSTHAIIYLLVSNARDSCFIL